MSKPLEWVESKHAFITQNNESLVFYQTDECEYKSSEILDNKIIHLNNSGKETDWSRCVSVS